MNDYSFLKTLVTSLNQSASVKNVFGEPVLSRDKVIIPVAQIILGMGGGYGNGIRQDKTFLPPGSSQPVSFGKPETGAEGAGSSGFIYHARSGLPSILFVVVSFIAARRSDCWLLGGPDQPSCDVAAIY